MTVSAMRRMPQNIYSTTLRVRFLTCVQDELPFRFMPKLREFSELDYTVARVKNGDGGLKGLLSNWQMFFVCSSLAVFSYAFGLKVSLMCVC